MTEVAFLRYNYRLYPTPEQASGLARAFGCARVVFNDGLRARQEAREAGLPLISAADLYQRVIMKAKQTTSRAWLGEVSSVVLGQALRDLHAAYANFFNSASGRRKGPKIAPPRFRSGKDHRQAIRFTRNGFVLRNNGRLYLARIGELAVRWSRNLPGEPSSVTVIKDATGRYFASFVIQVNPQPLPILDAEVGIDLGLTTFAVMSNGKTIANPRFLQRAHRRLRRLQQGLSRKEKGSKNREKARVRVAKAHARVRDSRSDWAHKATTTIIRENQAVYVEDLCVKGMTRTNLSRAIHDVGWSIFTRLLEQKAHLYGRKFGRVGRFFPSSKMCSSCGVVQESMSLKTRSWTCTCGATHDRDVNAAKNILAAGRADRLNACGASVRPQPVAAVGDEPGSRTNRKGNVLQPSPDWDPSA
jgi:putative transposase